MQNVKSKKRPHSDPRARTNRRSEESGPLWILHSAFCILHSTYASKPETAKTPDEQKQTRGRTAEKKRKTVRSSDPAERHERSPLPPGTAWRSPCSRASIPAPAEPEQRTVESDD
jgi:hypothetical protein